MAPEDTLVLVGTLVVRVATLEVVEDTRVALEVLEVTQEALEVLGVTPEEQVC